MHWFVNILLKIEPPVSLIFNWIILFFWVLITWISLLFYMDHCLLSSERPSIFLRVKCVSSIQHTDESCLWSIHPMFPCVGELRPPNINGYNQHALAHLYHGILLLLVPPPFNLHSVVCPAQLSPSSTVPGTISLSLSRRGVEHRLPVPASPPCGM